MKYRNTKEAIFIERPNRFIARVELDGKVETVHVKNTGRCKEILLPGVPVILEKSDNPNRKTAYDLIAVKKSGIGWINIDSQVPNTVVAEWAPAYFGPEYRIQREYSFGNSRIDFYLESPSEKILMEVKGCTLEIDGAGFFPDAPTVRGAKHLRELTGAVKEGYRCIVAFVIQMEGVDTVSPYESMDPEFARAFREAADGGVEFFFLGCKVTPDTLEIERAAVSRQLFERR